MPTSVGIPAVCVLLRIDADGCLNGMQLHSPHGVMPHRKGNMYGHWPQNGRHQIACGCVSHIREFPSAVSHLTLQVQPLPQPAATDHTHSPAQAVQQYNHGRNL